MNEIVRYIGTFCLNSFISVTLIVIIANIIDFIAETYIDSPSNVFPFTSYYIEGINKILPISISLVLNIITYNIPYQIFPLKTNMYTIIVYNIVLINIVLLVFKIKVYYLNKQFEHMNIGKLRPKKENYKIINKIIDNARAKIEFKNILCIGIVYSSLIIVIFTVVVKLVKLIIDYIKTI